MHVEEHPPCPVLAAKAEILREWENVSRERFPAASDKARVELRDHLPQLLESLCEFLAGAGGEDFARLSRIHGRQRFSFGDFTLGQILGEYKLLKEIVIRHDDRSRERLARAMRISSFFDDASATAAIEFVNLRERELRETGERLGRANDELARFTGVVAHDLRSPLATVSGFAELLDDESLSASARSYVATIAATTARSLRLIDRLLEYTRVSHAVPKFESVDLDEVWGSARQNLSSEIDQARASVTASNLGRVCGDAVLLGQLLQNLVANSLKFRTASRACEITIERGASTNGFSDFEVRDNGVGFDPTKDQEIFQPFARAHQDDQYKGSGLGLATCLRVVEAHGGRIRAHGEVGRGAIFYFTLPDECAR